MRLNINIRIPVTKITAVDNTDHGPVYAIHSGNILSISVINITVFLNT
jgi:hypothetical protein